MGKKKVTAVIDANVFISAILFSGSSEILVEHWQKGSFEYAISKEVLNEYIRVLGYPKLKVGEQRIEEIVKKELLPFTKPFITSSRLNVVKEDPSDNVFFNLAVDSKAEYIVSGDRHILSIKSHKGIKVIELSEFLKSL